MALMLSQMSEDNMNRYVKLHQALFFISSTPDLVSLGSTTIEWGRVSENSSASAVHKINGTPDSLSLGSSGGFCTESWTEGDKMKAPLATRAPSVFFRDSSVWTASRYAGAKSCPGDWRVRCPRKGDRNGLKISYSRLASLGMDKIDIIGARIKDTRGALLNRT